MLLVLTVGCTGLPQPSTTPTGPKATTTGDTGQPPTTPSTTDSTTWGWDAYPLRGGAVHLLRLGAGTVEVTTWRGEADPLGSALERVGDLDGDGVVDVASARPPVVLRSSDASLGQPLPWDGSDPLVPIGDLDGDDLPELTVRAGVFRGSDVAAGGTTTAWAVDGAARGAPGPDLDQDGLGETTWFDPAPAGGTRIRTVLGADVAVAAEVPLESAVNESIVIGEAERAWDLGDVDGDGVDDLGFAHLVVGAEVSLVVLSGATLLAGAPQEIGALWLASPSEYWPSWIEVVPLGDLDGDGRADLAVAANPGPKAEPVGRIVGGAEVATAELTTVGRAVPGYGLDERFEIDGLDVDGDGLTELMVHGHTGGSIHAGSDLAAGSEEPAWTWSNYDLSNYRVSAARLAGLDAQGRLLLWVGDPDQY